jgi:hypothetical protein
MRFIGLIAIVLAASGCGGGTTKVTVSGTVSYHGRPLSGGMLQFVSADGGAPAAAPIRKDGTFIMTGVVPGDVKVSLQATPTSAGPSGDKTATGKTITPDDLPEKYRDPETSGLSYTITPATKQLEIKID